METILDVVKMGLLGSSIETFQIPSRSIGRLAPIAGGGGSFQETFARPIPINISRLFKAPLGVARHQSLTGCAKTQFSVVTDQSHRERIVEIRRILKRFPITPLGEIGFCKNLYPPVYDFS